MTRCSPSSARSSRSPTRTIALAGTVQVQFFIKPDGTVASAAASGVDPAVASCVADVIKSLAFPKPNGGGGVQVNYPFTKHR
jgi:hypothetical protein